MEMREETADFLRSFAIIQFEKQHTKENDETDSNADSLVSNIRMAKVLIKTMTFNFFSSPETNERRAIYGIILTFQKASDPRRLYRRTDTSAYEEDPMRVRSTLMEYGTPSRVVQDQNESGAEDTTSIEAMETLPKSSALQRLEEEVINFLLH